MRYIIFGAGAIGGSIGARLHMAGEEVVLIARGEHYETILTEGLGYRNPETDLRLTIPVVNHPEKITFREDDVIFLTMKSQHTHQALVDLAACAPVELPIVCCQNGVANESLALRKFLHVYGMVVFLPATHLVPGEVLHYATTPGGVLDAGHFPHGTDSTVSKISEDLTQAGFISNADERAMRWKYAKLLQNLGNSLQAVSDAGRDAKGIMTQLRNEALECYKAAGIDCATAEESRERNSGVRNEHIVGVQRSGGSSWQSLQKGSSDIESDYLNGEICYLGRLHGIPTPANETLRLLANDAIKLGWKPGQLSVAEIEQAIAHRRGLS